jgi:hypothetical protein
MAPMERIGSSGTRVLSLVIAALGVAMVIRTLAAGGDATSMGVLLGVIFVALGCARLYLSARTAR